MKTIAVVPFKNELQLTLDLLKLLKGEELDEVYLMDNGSEGYVIEHIEREISMPSYGGRFKIFPCRGKGIYEMWNMGWEIANGWEGEVNLAMLNNDISFLPGTILVLTRALRASENAGIVYPDYNSQATSLPVEDAWCNYAVRETTGTYRGGGMCGWAFMIKAELLHDYPDLKVDENLKWWFGDDYIEMKVRASGHKVYRVIDLPCAHINEATASNGENNWTHEAKGKDVEYWKATYGTF